MTDSISQYLERQLSIKKIYGIPSNINEPPNNDKDNRPSTQQQKKKKKKKKKKPIATEKEKRTDPVEKKPHLESSSFNEKPVIVIVVGMAGSGKTTLVDRLTRHEFSPPKTSYVLNLDPAAMDLPYIADVDIKDTVRDNKQVAEHYNLATDDGILKLLDLFLSNFDEVISVIKKRANDIDYVLVDTPAQMELFTVSAAGAIITKSFASTFPTVIAYVVDTPLYANPTTFRDNMRHPSNILCHTGLQMMLVFNKIDVAPHQLALEWMEDFGAFESALCSKMWSTLKDSPHLFMRGLCTRCYSVGFSAFNGDDDVNAFFEALENSAKLVRRGVERSKHNWEMRRKWTMVHKRRKDIWSDDEEETLLFGLKSDEEEDYNKFAERFHRHS